MSQVDVVLLHGWGLNSGVWSDFVTLASEHAPYFRFHLLDLPGYGDSSNMLGSPDIAELAASCLERAPSNAIWLGWSLGGMVALQAAMQDQNAKISALFLVGVSPSFVERPDWPHGVKLEVFQRFANELSQNYKSALSLFLLLQSGASKNARSLARKAHAAICTFPDPSQKTLKEGIECLAHTDLRAAIMNSDALAALPSIVMQCEQDRVANPLGSSALAVMMGADLLRLKTGHAPFLTHPLDVLSGLSQLKESAYGA